MSKNLWAGEPESFQLVLSAEAKVEKLKADQAAAGAKAGWIEDMIAQLPAMWRHDGETAVITLNGPLVSGSAGLSRLWGVVGYDDLLAAVVEAASHVDTKKLLFDINTPGGAVTGIVDACEALAQITAIKPSSTYVGEQMCSAGYWLASAIKNNVITVSSTAEIGSIGVLSVHTERSKALADNGIGVTVIRSGKYKAETNSVEVLSEGAKARVEAQLADVHKIFRAQVAKGRPDLSADELAEVTEGQIFLGQKAVKAGLADKVGSFDMALNLLDKRKHSRDTSSKSKGKAMNLTPAQLTAIAAGAPLASFGFNADGSEMTAAEITAYEADVREKAAAKAAKEAEDVRIKAEADKANPSQAPPADTGVLALLTDQLAKANASIVQLNVAAVAHTAMAASHEGLLAIARAAVGNMLIPMGGSQAAVDGMDAAAVVAEHARVKPLFLAKFPVGRQSSTSGDDQSSAKADALPVGFQFAVKAAPSTAKR